MYGLIGGAMVIGGIVLSCAAFCGYMKKGVDEAEGFTELLSFKRRRISNFNEDSSKSLCYYDSNISVIRELLDSMGEGRVSAEAFAAVEGKLSVSPKVKELLSRYFAKAGKDYAEGELKLLDDTLGELGELVKKEREDLPRRRRVTYALGLALGVGLLILLL